MSNINPYNINGAYPVAGVTNSSQGFRDNFTNIKNNFLTAQSEITDLQNKAVLTSALNGGVINNNMSGSILGNVQLLGWTQALNNLGLVSGAVSIKFSSGNFQTLTTSGSITLGFSAWPTSVGSNAVGYATLRLWLTVSSTAHTVTFPSTININNLDIAGYNSSNYTITFDSAGTYVFDISSINGGSNYLITDVTRNRTSLRDPNLYFNAGVTASPTLFIGYGQNGGSQTSLNAVLAADQGQNIVSAVGSFNSVSLGNLALANISNATLDTGKVAGYTITSARGNLSTLTYSPVQSGDYLGYHNAVAYTGTSGTANTFQQLSSIVFYATGSNVTYGLGGNIAFYTADDGGNSANVVLQAMSINNDQSVEVFGALRTDAGIIERGTYLAILSNGASTFAANTATSTLIVDSTSSITLSNANITLPSNPPDRFRFKTVILPPVVTANIYAPLGANIKYAPTNLFTSGNTVAQWTYFSAAGTWYRS